MSEEEAVYYFPFRFIHSGGCIGKALFLGEKNAVLVWTDGWYEEKKDAFRDLAGCQSEHLNEAQIQKDMDWAATYKYRRFYYSGLKAFHLVIQQQIAA